MNLWVCILFLLQHSHPLIHIHIFQLFLQTHPTGPKLHILKIGNCVFTSPEIPPTVLILVSVALFFWNRAQCVIMFWICLLFVICLKYLGVITNQEFICSLVHSWKLLMEKPEWQIIIVIYIESFNMLLKINGVNVFLLTFWLQFYCFDMCWI